MDNHLFTLTIGVHEGREYGASETGTIYWRRTMMQEWRWFCDAGAWEETTPGRILGRTIQGVDPAVRRAPKDSAAAEPPVRRPRNKKGAR